jgi:hypothetical protein
MGSGSRLAKTGMQSLNRSMDFEPRMSKTKQKNVFTDPIAGTIQTYDCPRSPIESLDSVMRPKKVSAALAEFKRPQETLSNQGMESPMKLDRIAGGNRKAQPVVAYISPY